MLKNGICLHTLIAVRSSPSEAAEQLTQLLFGETFLINEQQNNWVYITSNVDSYRGWIDAKLVHLITDSQIEELKNKKKTYIQQPITKIFKVPANELQTIVAGSEIPVPKADGCFSLLGNNYKLESSTLQNTNNNSLDIICLAKQFINAPYLWGGKTLLGIDCSGFIQVIYRCIGVAIPRDASMQVEIGKEISFAEQAKQGDLAFFDNQEGHITHVGMILGEGKIIHASGSVRVDTIDHQGIYNEDLSKYTHNLRIIKRITDNPHQDTSK